MFRIFALLLLLLPASSWAQVVDSPYLDLTANRVLHEAEFLSAVFEADVILIGERHGRAGFQQRTQQLLQALALRAQYPALVLEMLQPAQMAVVAQHRAANPASASGLGAALSWWETGWPAWQFYQPIFQLAYHAKLPIYAGDLDAADQLMARDGARRGATGRALYPFADQPPGSPLYGSWLASLDRAHCGLVDDQTLAPRVSLQIARDQALALAAVRAAHGLPPGDALPDELHALRRQVVVLAGSAHTRHDRGVGFYLRALLPQARVVSVVLRERNWEALGVSEDEVPGVLAPPYDLQWAIQVEDRAPSQCARLREAGLL